MALVDQPSSEEASDGASLESRAYQIEMFEQAMRENTIVTMDTGSGKTQIAKLRIEAELEISPTKRVWFCAPSVVLAQQQHFFLSSQLPATRTRLITGLDNAQFWSTQEIWNAVLDGIDVVISTPQVLLDALSHGFVLMRQISLLVFDEAHHCIRNEPAAIIMQRFYTPLLDQQASSDLPHILGLTASPITNSASMLEKLEKNMNSVCRTPTLQVGEYKRHVYLPTIERLPFNSSISVSQGIVLALRNTVTSLSLAEDPTVKWLQQLENKSLAKEQKLMKIFVSGRSPIMKQMSSFLGHAEQIYHDIGLWAADLYIRTCASKLHNAVVQNEPLVPNLEHQEQRYMDTKLQFVLNSAPSLQHNTPSSTLVASKAQAVIDYLNEEYRPGITVIIFVKRRSVAFALTQLFQVCPQLLKYDVFSFVGATNPAYRTLVDLADVGLQKEAFTDFQNGIKNICIATQVMEEGVDIQATNVVIRFDEPETFRSFIQSRGRARRPDSKFVMVHSADEMDSVAKIAKWRDLEQMMKDQYSDYRRSMLDREAVEYEDESQTDTYRVLSTGALLTHDNARPHLEHFCATLPLDDNLEPSRPLIIISEYPGGLKSARVVLPSSVPASLQTTNSLRMWRSERMATKDAAFQTYKRLHTAKLINDNLLPYTRVKKVNEKGETRDSIYEVQEALDPWALTLNNTEVPFTLQAHRVRVSGHDFAPPDMIILLPIQLDCELSFTLHSTISGPLSVVVGPQTNIDSIDLDLTRQITRFLLTTILGRRLKRVSADAKMPYLILPETVLQDGTAWLERIQSTLPLSELTFNDSLERTSCLIKNGQEEILYMWKPSFQESSVRKFSPEESIIAERMSKQLSFFINNQTGQPSEGSVMPDIRTLTVSDCVIQGLPVGYGSFVLLIPSISHMITLALRGQLAARGPLAPIGLSTSALVVKGLTSSSASSEHNFEALEFVGDSLLKYYASIQVFFDNPDLTEGGLTVKAGKIINNARLQRVTKDLGLDAYISVDGFSGQKWSFVVADPGHKSRQMSSKTLADVVEALIGAAYLDPCNGPTMDEMPISALSHFFPEVTWKAPPHHIRDFQRSRLLLVNIARLEAVESMLGYQFRYKILLVEALTQTTLRVGSQSFQRLEFLGDAILDRLVNVPLYQSGHWADPGHLKNRRDAMVNRWILAFLAMETHHVTVTNDIETTVSGQSTIHQVSKTIRLVDHMRTSSDRSELQQRSRAETTFLLARDEIVASLRWGKFFPWIALHSIDAPKSYSDVMESILAAVFIDSGGNLSTCEGVLESLGLLPILRRLATEPDIDVRQPIVLLHLMCTGVQVEEKETGKHKDSSRKWSCTVSWEGQVIGAADSHVSAKHAEACAAELAVEKLSESHNSIDSPMEIDSD